MSALNVIGELLESSERVSTHLKSDKAQGKQYGLSVVGHCMNQGKSARKVLAQNLIRWLACAGNYSYGIRTNSWNLSCDIFDIERIPGNRHVTMFLTERILGSCRVTMFSMVQGRNNS